MITQVRQSGNPPGNAWTPHRASEDLVLVEAFHEVADEFLGALVVFGKVYETPAGTFHLHLRAPGNRQVTQNHPAR